MNDTKRLDDAVMAIGFLSARQEAQMYWLTQLYMLLSLRHPARMAADVRKKIGDILNYPPMGPDGMSQEELEARHLEQTPMIAQVGTEIAEHLEAIQRRMDEHIAEKVADSAFAKF